MHRRPTIAPVSPQERENGNRVLDVVELDEQGRTARVRAFYEQTQA
ncbi:hypothetical protein [Actinomadura fibrosa]|uniref:Uncharacterized protein n=1 Tax=Actinomadura fibrosa TaxID=111802 RepID=A0ABW2XHG8_9ACTN|nr:hypothetical protein [Actinomadura fibrosa]